MGYRFSVDLTALEQAAEGVSDVLGAFGGPGLTALPADTSVTGNSSVANALGDFCSRWEQGVQHLVTEGKQIADRLSYAAQAYAAYEDATRHAAAEGGTVAGNAPDPGTRQ